MKPFAGWENFYVIIGSSAGALIGLQFVVITLIADDQRTAEEARVGSSFATPTIIHFAAVLLLAGLVSAPWSDLGTVAVLWGLLGFSGVVYSAIITMRLGRQAIYRLQLEDKLFHVLLPLGAYGLLVASACLARWYTTEALFTIAAAAMLLLFIGIHNAWDNVIYHVFVRQRKRSRDESRE